MALQYRSLHHRIQVSEPPYISDGFDVVSFLFAHALACLLIVTIARKCIWRIVTNTSRVRMRSFCVGHRLWQIFVGLLVEELF